MRFRIVLGLPFLVAACGAEGRRTDGPDKAWSQGDASHVAVDGVPDTPDAGAAADDTAITDLTKHPCRSERDCAADQYCGAIGQGAPGSKPPDHALTYCLHKNSGEGFPPAAPRGR